MAIKIIKNSDRPALLYSGEGENDILKLNLNLLGRITRNEISNYDIPKDQKITSDELEDLNKKVAIDIHILSNPKSYRHKKN